MIRLSIVELLVHMKPNGHHICEQVVKLSEGITNESSVHAAILLYKARALRGLGMPTAAIDVLSDCLRETKDYQDELTNVLRYQRALNYEDTGQSAKCRAELERLYADASDYENVAERLGLQ